jgi:hypothetical protein
LKGYITKKKLNLILLILDLHSIGGKLSYAYPLETFIVGLLLNEGSLSKSSATPSFSRRLEHVSKFGLRGCTFIACNFWCNHASRFLKKCSHLRQKGLASRFLKKCSHLRQKGLGGVLSESTYSTLHEWGHILVDLDAKCIYVGRLDAK